ncbi:hypothetical protein [Paracoccus mutanolyticus]|uniref:hypothetical protein n=1 Tax=Paracoccus mutanolyticus TaxID=1499308 RepID=UPI0011AE4E5B|nr:hypothetical protein [Paracoccus mutanolyticus]
MAFIGDEQVLGQMPHSARPVVLSCSRIVGIAEPLAKAANRPIEAIGQLKGQRVGHVTSSLPSSFCLEPSLQHHHDRKGPSGCAPDYGAAPPYAAAGFGHGGDQGYGKVINRKRMGQLAERRQRRGWLARSDVAQCRSYVLCRKAPRVLCLNWE